VYVMSSARRESEDASVDRRGQIAEGIQGGGRMRAHVIGALYVYVCMYVKIRRHRHTRTRVNAHTGPRPHARAPACRVSTPIRQSG